MNARKRVHACFPLIKHQGGPAPKVADQVLKSPLGMHGECRALNSLEREVQFPVSVFNVPTFCRPVRAEKVVVEMPDDFVHPIDGEQIVGHRNYWSTGDRHTIHFAIKGLQVEPVESLGNKGQPYARGSYRRLTRALTAKVDVGNCRA